ncbi:hypothetical protein ACP70R_028634 [Stipagrostis hirtigluma subsp. patula]
MAYYQMAPIMCALVQTELYMHLYMNQIASGTNPSPNQLVIIPQPGFGLTAVNDWSLTEQPGATNPPVGHAKGFHMLASQGNVNWYISWNIIFEDSSFHGSTLNVMELHSGNGEWSIVGGTGRFSLAHGTIKYKVIQTKAGQAIYDLDIHAFYADMGPSAPPCNKWRFGS